MSKYKQKHQTKETKKDQKIYFFSQLVNIINYVTIHSVTIIIHYIIYFLFKK